MSGQIMTFQTIYDIAVREGSEWASKIEPNWAHRGEVWVVCRKKNHPWVKWLVRVYTSNVFKIDSFGVWFGFEFTNFPYNRNVVFCTGFSRALHRYSIDNYVVIKELVD